MAKLTTDQIATIAKNKNLEVVNVDEYVNLRSVLQWKCAKNHVFEAAVDTIRNTNFKGCPVCDRQVVKYAAKPPAKMGQRIIGFDQATKHFGVSVFDDGQLVYYDCVDFNDENTEARLAEISKFIDCVCKQWKPDFVEFEDIQLQGGAAGFKTFKVLAELLGIVIAVLNVNGVRHECVSNKVWQSTFMIAGKDRITQKNNVIKKVKELFGIEVSDDIADAILIGKYCVNKKRAAVTARENTFLF